MSKYTVVLRGGTLFARRYNPKGAIQMAFKERLGIPVGECVQKKVKKGMTPEKIREAVATCAKEKRKTKIRDLYLKILEERRKRREKREED